MTVEFQLSDYQNHFKDKKSLLDKLISGELLAKGVFFTPQMENDVSMHFVKDNKNYVITPEPDLIDTAVWEMATIDWINSKIEVEYHAKQHFHLIQWWNEITIFEKNALSLPDQKFDGLTFTQHKIKEIYNNYKTNSINGEVIAKDVWDYVLKNEWKYDGVELWDPSDNEADINVVFIDERNQRIPMIKRSFTNRINEIKRGEW